MPVRGLQIRGPGHGRGQPRGRATAARGSRNTVHAPTGESCTARRPFRIVVLPNSPRKQRSAPALASVGTASTAASSRSTTGAVSPRMPASPPARRHLGHALQHLGRRELAVAADPEHARRARADPPSRRSGRRRPSSRRRTGGWPARARGRARARPRPRRAARAGRTPSSRRGLLQAPRHRRPAPRFTSTSTVGSPRSSAMRASANRTPLAATRVAGRGLQHRGRELAGALDLVRACRGPGAGSIGRRSQVTPPTTGRAPVWSRQDSATPSAPTTSPPPPMPITSGRRAEASSASASIIVPPPPWPPRSRPRRGLEHARLGDHARSPARPGSRRRPG